MPARNPHTPMPSQHQPEAGTVAVNGPPCRPRPWVRRWRFPMVRGRRAALRTRLLTAPIVSARGALGLGYHRPEVSRPHTEPDGATHDAPRQRDRCPRRCPRSRRAGLMTAGALALSMAVAACGGPSTPGPATGSTAASTNPASHGASRATGLAAYTNCIRTHGVPNFSPHPTTSAGAPRRTASRSSRASNS
jgi:hypothetical protein